MCIVQKFGGSSLDGWECLRRSAELVLEAWRRGLRPLVVVSAAGDATDEMIQEAQSITPRPSPREMDALLATGEQRSAALMAIALEHFGAPARSFSGWQAGLITEEKHGEARIVRFEPARLLKALDAGEIPVVAGFQGVTPTGDITTLGRGGSDTTAVALAAALDAEQCEIFTDVDGVFTADPRLVPEAKRLEEIDLRDMLTLSEGGSQVLHAESVRMALRYGQRVRLLSSLHAVPGTRVELLTEKRRPALAGITRDARRHTVTLVGPGAPERAEALKALLADSGVPVESTAVTDNAVRFTVAPGHELEALQTLHKALF